MHSGIKQSHKFESMQYNLFSKSILKILSAGASNNGNKNAGINN